ncbi:tyrosine-type recombinase/integrase [Nocardiopsis mangrovi]|uniref:Tyrosine-type recombinase/integrase n=1 Tax=Nocardiopsis mangrovi TaxID=1179818 RepID=A0ABV9E375_9ACTN
MRRPPPSITRHTAASWLVQNGVEATEIQRSLGNEDDNTTLRYAHPAPDSHDKLLEAPTRRWEDRCAGGPALALTRPWRYRTA